MSNYSQISVKEKLNRCRTIKKSLIQCQIIVKCKKPNSYKVNIILNNIVKKFCGLNPHFLIGEFWKPVNVCIGLNQGQIKKIIADHPRQPNEQGREVAPFVSQKSLLQFLSSRVSRRLLIVRHPFDRSFIYLLLKPVSKCYCV